MSKRKQKTGIPLNSVIDDIKNETFRGDSFRAAMNATALSEMLISVMDAKAIKEHEGRSKGGKAGGKKTIELFKPNEDEARQAWNEWPNRDARRLSENEPFPAS